MKEKESERRRSDGLGEVMTRLGLMTLTCKFQKFKYLTRPKRRNPSLQELVGCKVKLINQTESKLIRRKVN